MEISKKFILNNLYLFISKRRWLRRLNLIKLPEIGFYITKSGIKYAVPLCDWRGPAYHLIKWGEETYEPENKESLLAFLPDVNGVFIDVGANIGLFSFYYKTRKPQLKAYLFEPEPLVNRCLKKTIAWNDIDNFKVLDLGLSNKKSDAILFTDGMNYGGNSFNANSIINERSYIRDKIEVKTSTLDTFVKEQNLSVIHCIKIDVQGHEYEVISGALSTIEEYKPVLLIECFFNDLCSDKSILKLFEKINGEKDFFIFEPKTKRTFSIQELYEHAVVRNKENNLSFSDFMFIPENEENKHIVSLL